MADKLNQIVRIIPAFICVCLITRNLRHRAFRMILGAFTGLIAGLVFSALLTETGPELPKEFTLVTTLLGGLLGGWIGNLSFQRSEVVSDVLTSEPDPKESPLWDRELDG